MNMVTSIINFLKITKKKMVMTLIFPLAAVLILLSGFILDEIFRLSGTTIVNAIYSLGNYFFLFIFLPLTFIDDYAPSIVFKITLVVTVIWWYILSCISVFLLEKHGKDNHTTASLDSQSPPSLLPYLTPLCSARSHNSG